MSITNTFSITSPSFVAAAALFRHPSRRRLYYSFTKIRTRISFLNCTPNSLLNFSTITKTKYPMHIAAASTAGPTAELTPLSADEPDETRPSSPQPWLIAGLGNPGKRYNYTRHNVGFEMVDRIAEAEGISMTSVSFKALFGKGFIGNVPVMLIKPQTFMNASGESVGALVSYYKIPPKQLFVIYDDMDLPFAKLRLLPKGGHGGHNGMKNIINHLKGSRDFPRFRIGIGRPPGKMDPANFVLRPFSKEEREELDFMFEMGLEAVRILLLEGFDRSATFVNSAKRVERNC